MASNGEVPGFKDLKDELAAVDDMAHSNLRKDIDELEKEIANETPDLEINSNSNLRDQEQGDNEGGGINSTTRINCVL